MNDGALREERADPTKHTTLTESKPLDWPKISAAAVEAMPQFSLCELIAASPDPITFEAHAAL
jgi:hypothetical protein